MSSLPISLNQFRKTFCEGMSRSQTIKAFDRFINDGTLPTKQEVKQDQDHQVASALSSEEKVASASESALAIEEKCCVCL